MIILAKGSIMEWYNGLETLVPTEHNRSELQVDVETFGSSNRMANARKRKQHVADKRTWSVSWSMLPADSAKTVDGKAGGAEIEEFFDSVKDDFSMRIKHSDSILDGEYQVTLESFDKTHVKRGAVDFWDLSLTIEEV